MLVDLACRHGRNSAETGPRTTQVARVHERCLRCAVYLSTLDEAADVGDRV